ncbi:MAG TPA: hypothetical protein VHH73_12785 [Verrucomicrobiae bacterium]|nr:hypothetical protein [Verrucomicrobiae bacterium]
MFADIAPANHTDWLNNLGWFLQFLTLVIVLWDRVTDRPKKREVTFTEEFARQEDLDYLREDVDALEEKLTEMARQCALDKDQIIAAGETRATRIHERIESMESELRALPHQMVTLLRNTQDLR